MFRVSAILSGVILASCADRSPLRCEPINLKIRFPNDSSIDDLKLDFSAGDSLGTLKGAIFDQVNAEVTSLTMGDFPLEGETETLSSLGVAEGATLDAVIDRETMDFLNNITYQSARLKQLEYKDLNASQKAQVIPASTAGVAVCAPVFTVLGTAGGIGVGLIHAGVGAIPFGIGGFGLGLESGVEAGLQCGESFANAYFYNFEYKGRPFKMRYSDMRAYGDTPSRKLPDFVNGFDRKHSWFTSKESEFQNRDAWFEKHFPDDADGHREEITSNASGPRDDYQAKKQIYDMFVNFLKDKAPHLLVEQARE